MFVMNPALVVVVPISPSIDYDRGFCATWTKTRASVAARWPDYSGWLMVAEGSVESGACCEWNAGFRLPSVRMRWDVACEMSQGDE